MTEEPFKIPNNVEDAEELLVELRADVDKIQHQLGTNKLVPNHTEKQAAIHKEWKRKARHAWNRKLDQLRRVKQFIKQARTQEYAEQLELDEADPEKLLGRLYLLVSVIRARNTGVALHEHEIRLLDVVSGHINKQQRRGTG